MPQHALINTRVGAISIDVSANTDGSFDRNIAREMQQSIRDHMQKKFGVHIPRGSLENLDSNVDDDMELDDDGPGNAVSKHGCDEDDKPGSDEHAAGEGNAAPGKDRDASRAQEGAPADGQVAPVDGKAASVGKQVASGNGQDAPGNEQGVPASGQATAGGGQGAPGDEDAPEDNEDGPGNNGDAQVPATPRFICQYCHKVYSVKYVMKQHILDRHVGKQCHWPGCGFIGAAEDDLIKHFLKHQRDAIGHGHVEKEKCPWPGCTAKGYSRKDSVQRCLKRHNRRAGGGQ